MHEFIFPVALAVLGLKRLLKMMKVRPLSSMRRLPHIDVENRRAGSSMETNWLHGQRSNIVVDAILPRRRRQVLASCSDSGQLLIERLSSGRPSMPSSA